MQPTLDRVTTEVVKLRVSALALVVAASAPATAAAYDAKSPAASANQDLRFGLAPVLLVPAAGGTVGGGLHLELRYGIGADPVIVAPGGRIAAYYLADRFAFLGMPNVRVTLPAGAFAPYLVAGAGLGAVTSSTSEGSDRIDATGLALMGGGGCMVHFTASFGLGVEVTYQTITSSDFSAVAIAPAFAIGL